MLKIPARSKLVNLQNSVKLYYILAIGAFITVLTFVLYKDFIVTGTMLISTVAAFIISRIPPRQIVIELTEEYIKIGDEEIKLSNCTAWSLSDLADTLEFTIQTTQFSQQFYYFYVPTQQPGAVELITALSQFLPYSEDVASKNLFHVIMRIIGLK